MADADTRAVVVGEFVRLVLDFRLIAVLLTVIWLRLDGTPPPAAGALVTVVGLASFVALMRWAQLGRLVAAHPAALAADLVLGTVALMVVGVDSPLVYALVGTALLAGALYGNTGAAVFSVLLVACHEAVALTGGQPLRFATVITVPALYPAAAFAAAAIGRVIIERADAVRRAAGLAARTAVARDLHDTLAKTVQGLRFTASALERAAVRGEPEVMRRHAAALRGAAVRAEQEARALMRGWRVTDEASATLEATIAGAVRECVGDRGPQVEIDCRVDDRAVGAEAHLQIELVVREALRNVVAHARAQRVRVRLQTGGTGPVLRLSVSDDGVGWPARTCLSAAAEAGHYGVVGMTERVRRLGGAIELTTGELGGAEVAIEVPLGAGDRRTTRPEVVA